MISADNTFLLILFVVFLLSFVGLMVSFVEKTKGPAALSVMLALVGGFILGSYLKDGRPLSVNRPGSTADLVAGHYYENLVKVPTPVQPEKTKTNLFVIKDGVSNKTLLIRIDHETLPRYFTVGDKGRIITLPAPEVPNLPGMP